MDGASEHRPRSLGILLTSVAVLGIAIGGFVGFAELAIMGTEIANVVRGGADQTITWVAICVAVWAIWIAVIVVGIRRARARRSWAHGIRWFGVAMPVTAAALVVAVLPAMLF